MAREEIPIGRLVVAMVAILVVGAPIVLYGWWTLDQVLAGIFRPVPIVVAVGLAAIFLAVAALVGRYMRSLVSPDG